MNRQIRVLVVDDRQVWRDELVEILQRGEFYATAVSTVTEAYRQIRTLHYDFVILDVRMDAEDETYENGLKLLEMLAASHEKIQVILLSAHITCQEIQDVLANQYVLTCLSKDQFNEQLFLASIKRCF